MEFFLATGSVLGALALGTVSPGPSFVFVARTAVARSRRHGLAAALGMGTGGVLFAALALAGMQAAIAAMPSVFTGFKAAGALYLIYLGWCMWRGARGKIALDAAASAGDAGVGESFRRALFTQLSNPKTAVVYGSVFAALLPQATPAWLACVLAGIIFAMETAWYAFVAVALSAESPRAFYLRGKTALDRSAGGVMTLLGIKLLLDARSPMQ